MLLSDKAPVAPPTISSWLPNAFLITLPSSPANFKPSSIVATSRLITLPSVSFDGLPSLSFGTYTIRSDLLSLLASGFTSVCVPWSVEISILAPGVPGVPAGPWGPWGPVKPMWPTPSLPEIDTASLPSLPEIPTLPSIPLVPGVPVAPCGPMIVTPSLPGWPSLPLTTTLSKLVKSLFNAYV